MRRDAISPAQRKVLLNLLNGREAAIHLRDASAHASGFLKTAQCLVRKGWLKISYDRHGKYLLTEAGREVAESLK